MAWAGRPSARHAQALKLDARAPGAPLDHFWSRVVGAGRANEALRATWQEALRIAVDQAGFRYVRFHGIFHDDMFVYREEPDGTPVYSFQYIDDVFDRLLAQGVRPFVELGFSPSAMATVKDTIFWWKAHGSPPKDLDKWNGLVSAFARHCIQRYGIDEVRQWYFEVWNEPNLSKPFFRDGTQQQYFELYRATALTLKRIDPRLRVGGPATSNFTIDQNALARLRQSGKPFDPLSVPWQPVWVQDFLDYCQQHQLPVDFVSTHPYPTDFALEQVGELATQQLRRSADATRDDLRTIRALVDRSAYPHAEIQLTEWSTSTAILDHSHDSLAAAAAILRSNLDSIGLVDSLSYWVFTDLFEEYRKQDSIFHGGFGLINYQQIVKPAFHAYRFMQLLGDEVLGREEGAIVTRHSQNGAITALFYNYPPEMRVALPISRTLAAADAVDASGSSRVFSLQLEGLPPGAVFELETLDRQHGNAVFAWQQMGMPEPPTREQTAVLRQAAWATAKDTRVADADGRLDWKGTLPAWSVVCMRQSNQ
ncbi:MAG: hypothetical protein QM581_14720 [Pseudomonas sp.]